MQIGELGDIQGSKNIIDPYVNPPDYDPDVDPITDKPILEDTVLNYVCNGISRVSNGGFLLVGPIVNQKGAQKGKSIFAKYTSDLENEVQQLYPVLPSDDQFIFKEVIEIAGAVPSETNY